MNSCFVGGSVTADIDNVEECAEGATVVLKQNGNEIAQTKTDAFGEFKIDQLIPGSGSYELQVSSDSMGSASKTFDLGDESVYLGELKLGT